MMHDVCLRACAKSLIMILMVFFSFFRPITTCYILAPRVPAGAGAGGPGLRLRKTVRPGEA